MYSSLLCKKALEISFLADICNVHGAVGGKFAFMNSRLSWHPDIKIYINTYDILNKYKFSNDHCYGQYCTVVTTASWSE